ncbi:dCTP deaminase [Candidatus Woesearchaeota archaeon]|nr:dCTP deaminase [Candidatus Woesearchaeota archaeon]MBW3013688.1 dCTP deaminase [Candidatus Woesearchaeota archaeon]
MTILTKEFLQKEIRAKRVVISPYNPKNIGPGSIDLTLSNNMRKFKEVWRTFDVKEGADYKNITEELKIKEYYILEPAETILIITKEKVTLPKDLCGWIFTRSRFARLGLITNTSFVQPGSSNNPVLEIHNIGPRPLAIYPGTKVCQLVIGRTEGEAKYKGKFKQQKKV